MYQGFQRLKELKRGRNCQSQEDKSDHPDILIMPLVHGKAGGFAHESIRDFVNRLHTKQEFIAGFEDGYRVSMVVFSLLSSAEEKMPQKVNYD